MKTAGFTLLAILIAHAAAAENSNYMLLQDRYGEMCTMCVASLTCMAPESTAHTVYTFQKKGFVGQMMTVLDYVPGVGRGVWEKRDVRIVETNSEGKTSERTEIARLSIQESKIEVASTAINRTTGAWTSAGGKALGQCAADTVQAVSK